jgi:hypothetical protein
MFEPEEDQSGIRMPTRRVERRGQERADLDVPVLVDSQRRWATCQCRDVSAGGLALCSSVAWQAGTRVEVYFELPSGRAIEVSAKVVASEPGMAHLSFVDLRPSLKAVLSTYVKLQNSPVARQLRLNDTPRPVRLRLQQAPR